MLVRRFLALIAAAAGVAAGCSSSTVSSSDAPLPTVGLGSDIGQISVGADVRAVGSAQIDTVIMVGDSITVGSETPLQVVFERLGFDGVVIEAQQSKRIARGSQSNPAGTDVARFLVDVIDSGQLDTGASGFDDDPTDHSNELWVVALGTNDVAQFSDAAERADVVNEMLSIVPDESPLVWVNTYVRDHPDSTAALNSTIAEQIDSRSDSMVADWSAVAPFDGVLQSDGVHPRESGTVAFANLVGSSIVELLGLG